MEWKGVGGYPRRGAGRRDNPRSASDCGRVRAVGVRDGQPDDKGT